MHRYRCGPLLISLLRDQLASHEAASLDYSPIKIAVQRLISEILDDASHILALLSKASPGVETLE